MESRNPLRENFEDYEALPQLVIGLPGRSALKKALATTVQELTSEYDSTVPHPKLFDIAQFIGMVRHEQILRLQGEAAMVVLEDPVWGARLRHLKHPEIPEACGNSPLSPCPPSLRKPALWRASIRRLTRKCFRRSWLLLPKLRHYSESAAQRSARCRIAQENGSEDSNEATQVPELRLAQRNVQTDCGQGFGVQGRERARTVAVCSIRHGCDARILDL